jgi:hypothetical protein
MLSMSNSSDGGAFGARRVDAVDEQRDLGVGVFGLRAVVADAAQGHRDDAVVAFGRRLEAGHEVDDVGDRLHVRSCRVPRR